jgi:nucleotide-binding universal stress UspA family protein
VFKSIVLGVDSSEYSRHAQTLAFYLARKLHASVLGLHVVDILSFEGPLFNDIAAPADLESYLDAPQVRETLTARGRKLLEDFAAAAVREQVSAQTVLDFGVVAAQICERSKSADLVVLGHRAAHEQVAATNPGGIAESVARKASGTVLICPAVARELRQVVLAFDGSERACKAMHAAAELASALDASLTVLSVSRDPRVGEHRLAQARAYFAPYGIKTDFRHLSGHAPAEIVAFIRQASPDALFIGAYGHSRIVEMMLGSTTEQVLRNAPCPLFLSR